MFCEFTLKTPVAAYDEIELHPNRILYGIYITSQFDRMMMETRKLLWYPCEEHSKSPSEPSSVENNANLKGIVSALKEFDTHKCCATTISITLLTLLVYEEL